MSKLKNVIRKFLQATPFVLNNTIILVPYLLFMQLSDGTTLETVLPFVLFYTCRMTGIFLLKSFRFSLTGFTLLISSILIGGLGSLLGVVGTRYFPGYLLAAICLGLSAAWFPASNATVNFQEKKKTTDKTSKKHPAVILILFASLLAGLTLPAQYRLPIVFALYTLFYIAAYHTVTHYPDYGIDFQEMDRRIFSIKEFLLFVLFFCLLIILRLARLLVNSHYLTISILGFSVIFLAVAWLLARRKFTWQLPFWLNALTFITGMCGNFIFLFGTFYTAIKFGSDNITRYLYLPYLGAVLCAMLIGKKIYHYFSQVSPKVIHILGLSLGLILLLIPQLFVLGVFVVSFFVSFTNTFLINEYYYKTHLPENQRMIAKYSTQAKGSIAHQFLLLGGLLLLAKEHHLTGASVLQLTSKHVASQTTYQLVEGIHRISILFLLLLLSILSAVLWKKTKDKK